MPDEHRTSDGFVRAEHLRRGAIDQRGWLVGTDWHIIRLTLRRPRPELWEVEHRIIHHHPGTSIASSTTTNSELFNTLTEARRQLKALRKSPPSSYPSPEVA